MIKKEHIKQAIDGISKRDVHIGYALDRMLGMGVIGVSVSTGGLSCTEAGVAVSPGLRRTVSARGTRACRRHAPVMTGS